MESLRRFLRPAALNDYPTSTRPNATLSPAWQWHNYEPFTTPDGVNRLERLGVPATIEEYSMHAQLAQLFQYQALYEGFQVNLKMPNHLTCSEQFETRQDPQKMHVIAAQSVHMVLCSGVLEVSKSVAGAPG